MDENNYRAQKGKINIFLQIIITVIKTVNFILLLYYYYCYYHYYYLKHNYNKIKFPYSSGRHIHNLTLECLHDCLHDCLNQYNFA